MAVGKSTFARLLTPENAPRMGLRAPSEAAKARLGAPLVDHIIGLTDLQSYDGTHDPVFAAALLDGMVNAGTEVVQLGYEGEEGMEVDAIVDRAAILDEALASMRRFGG